ncbi:hypothetical protein AwDysgo_12560 [Bacteroidales bacterium]|nr:hypothetical protein AwDysgo_12560 [Bacteroidales bacterium]
MTEDQAKVIGIFEARLRQMMFVHDDIKAENIAVKKGVLLLEQNLQEALDEINQLKVRYDHLKMARVISVNREDVKGSKDKLLSLVQEIDKCIALLNE